MTTLAPVKAVKAREPIDLDALAVVLTRELRRQRHGDPGVVCWGCPRDAAGLAGAVDAAARAGLL